MAHKREPYVLRERAAEFRVACEPAESSTPLFDACHQSGWTGLSANLIDELAEKRDLELDLDSHFWDKNKHMPVIS
jgi:hypothetical protein